MPTDPNSPQSISELIDRLDQIREDLLSVQRALEKLEPAEAKNSRE